MTENNLSALKGMLGEMENHRKALESKILNSVHETAKGLHKAEVIDDKAMNEFDLMCKGTKKAKKRLTPRSKLGRTLEKKIMFHLEAARDSDLVEGLQKSDLKRILMSADDYMNMSINTIKGAVDRLLDDGKIECINPANKVGLRFRVRNTCVNCGDSHNFKINGNRAQCDECGAYNLCNACYADSLCCPTCSEQSKDFRSIVGVEV